MESIIKTYSGNFIDLLNLDADKITPYDIAQGTSQTCRYGGQCNKFYSTAEHSCLVVRLMQAGRETVDAVRLGYAHDWSEGIGMGDMVNPLKNAVPTYRDIEDTIITRLLDRFCVKETPRLWKTVKVYDNAAFLLERELLFDDVPRKQRKHATALFGSACKWRFGLQPQAAKSLFLRLWDELNIYRD